MDSAVYALVVNACVALLFAVAFAVIRLSYPGQRPVEWFCAIYLIGMLTPLCELGVRYSDSSSFFVGASYATFLLCMLGMPLGLSAIAHRPLPWRSCAVIGLAGVVGRIAIWNGPRNDLGYEFVFQAPFAAAAATAAGVAIGATRNHIGRLWLAVAIVFGAMVMHFLTKPIFAHMFGSGATAKAYTASPYALFSQAVGGVLVITAGLLVLLIVVQSAMGRTMLEAQTDPLTAILNRRGFEDQSNKLIANAHRTGAPLAAVVFDLDHFKQINDSFGHATGDAVIRAFADLLRVTVSPSGVIARLGGEEFCILLDRTTLRGAWQVAQAIRLALALADLGSHLPAVTVSGGIAELHPGDTLKTLIDRADRFAYVAKAAGRNRVCPTPERGITERGTTERGPTPLRVVGCD